jgi:hypothetical protein
VLAGALYVLAINAPDTSLYNTFACIPSAGWSIGIGSSNILCRSTFNLGVESIVFGSHMGHNQQSNSATYGATTV